MFYMSEIMHQAKKVLRLFCFDWTLERDLFVVTI